MSTPSSVDAAQSPVDATHTEGAAGVDSADRPAHTTASWMGNNDCVCGRNGDRIIILTTDSREAAVKLAEQWNKEHLSLESVMDLYEEGLI